MARSSLSVLGDHRVWTGPGQDLALPGAATCPVALILLFLLTVV